MAGQKRPSDEIPAPALERAIELRRSGKAWRAIAVEVGWSKSALHERLREDPRLVGERGATPEDADDLDRADRLKGTFDRGLEVLDSAIAQVAKKVADGAASVADVNGLAGAIERVLKLALQLERRGAAGGTGPGVLVNVGVVQHSPAEAAALGALAALRAERGGAPAT